MPVVNPLVFYPWQIFDVVRRHLRLGALAWRFHRARKRVESDPAKLEYMDLALTLDHDQALEAPELLARRGGFEPDLYIPSDAPRSVRAVAQLP